MADQLKNMPKATRIGGRGSMRRKLKSTTAAPPQPNVGAALKGFKRQLSQLGHVGNFTLEYENGIQVFQNPDVKVIMADRKTPMVYVVTGKSKMVNIKSKEDGYWSGEEDEGTAQPEQAVTEDKEIPSAERKDESAEHEVPDIEDID